MDIQLFAEGLLEGSSKEAYRRLKTLLMTSIISLPIQQTAVSQTPPWIANPNAGDDIIGVNYNYDLEKKPDLVVKQCYRFKNLTTKLRISKRILGAR